MYAVIEPQEHEPLEVTMGDLRVGTGPETLHAILGSCVGIAFIWKKGGRCGLAHCLLPEAPEQWHGASARYIDKAVPALLMSLGARPRDYADIEVIVAGGASMFPGKSPCFQVGERNCVAVRKYLAERGLRLSYCELGGYSGREITIDCARQTVNINAITGYEKESYHGSH